MSVEYDTYLAKHTGYVETLYNYFWGEPLNCKHDSSKFSEEEYNAYDKHWYPKKAENKSLDYEYAVLHHIHNNPHHWQYWVAIDENPSDFKLLPIPERYLKEMVADWASFSMMKNDADELLKWYRENKENIYMEKESKEKLEKMIVYAYKKLKAYLK